ncbi:hypothetical protein BQ8794_220153 [Mesorhizobium prunaredense]|uniref:Uncharacterized protein n=1 Tax=Mesorhizobium prunaredense TaxID=1631249 RepID=A0A1R3V8L2_9HYPH|nr:hypothetical protein BQ8794_220153 [Mesorhizobium prunaredense]
MHWGGARDRYRTAASLDEWATGWSDIAISEGRDVGAEGKLSCARWSPQDGSDWQRAQCQFQAIAFQAICGIDTVRLYDIDPKPPRRP